jgi:hypothetical protein
MKTKKGRPRGGHNYVYVRLDQLQSILQGSALVPISIKFARQIGFGTNGKKVLIAEEKTKPITVQQIF